MSDTDWTISHPSALLLACFAIAVSLVACSKDSSPNGPDLTISDKEHITRGWQHFEAQQYDSAITSFTSAYTGSSTASVRGEALTGRGWSSMYKRDLSKANSDFVLAIGLTGITPVVLNDARVGNAFALYATNSFSDAASNAVAALTDNSSYAFAHDAKVTTKRLRLLLAQSYYANGQFTFAAAQLDIVDPARAPHSADPAVLLGTITAVLNSL